MANTESKQKKKLILTVVIIVAILAATGGVFGYQQYQLSSMRKAGVAAAEKLANIADYRKAQAKEVTDIIQDLSGAIQKSKSQKEIDNMLSATEKKIAGIKTDAQLDKEEKAAKLAAKKKAEAKKKAAEEKRRKEAAAAAAAAEAQQSQAASTSSGSSGSSAGSSSGSSGGCVGNDASNFY